MASLEESGGNVKLTNHLPLVPSLRISGAISHIKCFVACTMITLALFFQVEVVSLFSVAYLFLATLKL
jgi:hypothetical protein